MFLYHRDIWFQSEARPCLTIIHYLSVPRHRYNSYTVVMSCKGKKLNRKCKEFFIKTRKLVGINFKIFFSLYNYTVWQLGPLEIIAFYRRQVVKYAYICGVDVKDQRLPDLSKRVPKYSQHSENLTRKHYLDNNYYDYGIKDGARHDWGTFLYWSNRRSNKVGVNSSSTINVHFRHLRDITN